MRLCQHTPNCVTSIHWSTLKHLSHGLESKTKKKRFFLYALNTSSLQDILVSSFPGTFKVYFTCKHVKWCHFGARSTLHSWLLKKKPPKKVIMLFLALIFSLLYFFLPMLVSAATLWPYPPWPFEGNIVLYLLWAVLPPCGHILLETFSGKHGTLPTLVSAATYCRLSFWPNVIDTAVLTSLLCVVALDFSNNVCLWLWCLT